MANFNVKDFLEGIFKVGALRDEDGIYHYLLEEKHGTVQVNVTDTGRWANINMSNKLILDYDRSNSFSLMWFNNNNKIVEIEVMEVNDGKYTLEQYKENDRFITEEKIQLYSIDLAGRYLEIILKPHLSIALKVKY